MRDLLFKNLTSLEKKKKVISKTEVMEKEGIRSTIHRHFIWLVKEISDDKIMQPSPFLYVLKERNHKEQRERFLCKIKGSICTSKQGKIYTIHYLHSLQVNLTQIHQEIAQ